MAFLSAKSALTPRNPYAAFMSDALREPKFLQRRRSSWRASSLLLVSKRAVAELVEGVFLREAAATRASSRGWRESRAIAFFWTANKTCVTICGATTTLAFEEYYTAHAWGDRHLQFHLP